MAQNQNLLKEAGRAWELLVGWACALIGLAFGILLVGLVYFVGWRNPREYGKHELFDAKTLAVFALFLVIAVGFSVLAVRLISGRSSRGTLMSPIVLRVWGVVFGLGSVMILIDAIIHKRWRELPHLWYTLMGSASMAVAAFVLAGTRARKETTPPEAIDGK